MDVFVFVSSIVKYDWPCCLLMVCEHMPLCGLDVVSMVVPRRFSISFAKENKQDIPVRLIANQFKDNCTTSFTESSHESAIRIGALRITALAPRTLYALNAFRPQAKQLLPKAPRYKGLALNPVLP